MTEQGNARQVPVVLLVDDQPANVRVVGQLLARAGFDVVPALNGEDGLALATDRAPDLVLLDMRMPGLGGFEVLQALQALPATREVPVIFLTADDERDSLTRAFAAGAVDYIVKPFVAEELLGRVRTHIELKQSRDALKRIANERQQMADTIAHDLRNYFTNVLFAADMLRDPDLPLDTRLRLVDSIRQSGDSGMLFLQAVLEHQGHEAQGVALARLDSRILLEDVAALLEPQARAKGIAIEVRAQEPVQVLAQQAGAVHVLQNLLSNAIKYSPPQGEVTLQAIVYGRGGRLSVMDRGPGVSKSDQAKLFQRYVRLSAQPTQGESSTGLGLALAKQRARTMGGDLWYDPREGGGSIFTLELPLA
ncbi:response regulator [Arenimonas sp.]|uniref:hybrid sensor histidine kinase/response regulator n=1 Tax=Arenimonas sp. TaxID=1872635 RepID=UPI0039E6D86D